MLPDAISPADIPAEISGMPDVPCVVFYDMSAEALAHALQAGDARQQVLARWQARCEALLMAQRQMPGRVFLVDAQSLSRDPMGFLSRFGAHFDLSVPNGATIALAPGPDMALTVALAGYGASGEPAILQLNTDLEAASLQLTPRNLPEEAAAAYRAYKAERARLDTSLVEMEAMSLQLHEMLSALEASVRRESTLHAEKSELEQARTKGREEAAGEAGLYREKLTTDAEEHALMLLQILSLQDELENRFLEERSLRNRIDAQNSQTSQLEQHLADTERGLQGARDRIQGLEAVLAFHEKQLHDKDVQLTEHAEALQAVWNSTSWKITGPMRRVKSRFFGSVNPPE